MSRKQRLAMGSITALVVAATAGYVVARAHAAGVPMTAPVMTYSGTLTDTTGAPLPGSKNISIQLWDVATGGSTPLCVTPSAMETLIAGAFQIVLPDPCVAAVHSHAEIWLEVSVDGAPLPRTKLGAVPYALEAATASSAGGALNTRLNALVPPKGIVTANLSASDLSTNFDGTGLGIATGPYAGWAVCNGMNGTPNLANRFVRVAAAAAGATGGSDSNAHTHGTPSHQHVLPVGFDGSNIYLTADANNAPMYGSNVITANRGAPASGAYASGLTRQGFTDNSGAGTTGPASATENRPAYFELVALMRL
jgi:hypothetical protein